MKQLNTRELRYLLKNNGFDVIRRSKHEIWSNGEFQVAVPTHGNLNIKLATKIVNNCGLRNFI